MKSTTRAIVLQLLVCALLIGIGSGTAVAEDEWKFGIGTGISSFGMDGDLGFATPMGGVIADIDFDNSDTSDLVESGFGFGGYAAKGKWKIIYQLGTATLEDDNAALDVEWDRTRVDLAGVYNFAVTGKNRWGVLFGTRYMDHDWDITTAMGVARFDESWTDALVGITHALPINDKWIWTNHIDAGFGGSEGSFLIKTAINWRAFQRWTFNASLSQHSIEFGEKSDMADSDFYLYDVDEPTVGLGFMFSW